MTNARTQPRRRPMPPHFRDAQDFVESAKEVGVADLLSAARRVWWWVNFPYTHNCTEVDKALFDEFRNA